MFKFKKSLVAACALLAGSAYALPQFAAGKVNSINFQAYENAYRTNADCAASGGCLGAGTGPAGWQLVDPLIPGNIKKGDVFAGVLEVTKIVQSSWFESATDQFTGYFAQQVVDVDTTTPTNAVATLGTVAVDPFGKLAAGEMFRLYTDSSTTVNLTGSGLAAQLASIASATDGTYWGTLGLDGLGAASKTFAYTVDDATKTIFDTGYKGKNESSLVVLTQGPSYNLPKILKGNDPGEALMGGVAVNNLNIFGDKVTCTAADIANPLVKCADAVGNADIKATDGSGPWIYNVNDPLFISLVPEPGSIALVGIALVGVAGIARSRKSV